MPVRPPSLRAIAAFEAAARHQSFTRAADELNLTQSAISHAIRSLELRLGVELFERFGRTVVLTEAGRAFVSRLRLSLDLISEAFDVQPKPSRTRIILGAPAGVLERVLAPRLNAFVEANPEPRFELRLLADHGPVTAGEVDVAVLFGAGACSGLARRRLAGETLIPVAAPAADLPRRPEDLARARLIHQPGAPWRLWLEQVGLGELVTPAGVTIDNPVSAIELARCGAGVALAPALLVREDLAARRLVRLFDAEAPLREDYAAVWNPAAAGAEAVQRFVDWLAGELAPSQQPAPLNAAA
ncbi:LysR substrate-binding domain-containing protein [Phenylobacterium sp.]|jgi:LysR family glycine cleavage system transcriptional activator|uniref:LysR substrate-binding domain-containing protein n=1 Tax=Phenylobacterium sp. TaxID=1871053 RepID=UPI002F946936